MRLLSRLLLLALPLGFCAIVVGTANSAPQRVSFQSLDGKTQLVGYLFSPRRPAKDRSPAIVMMHGRAGPYSTAAHGRFDATTISKRHLFWGRFWAEQGYFALLVDGFGPRGYPEGFPIHSYAERPDAVNEVTVRPLDAYGALLYLRGRSDVDGARIALQGWSNGGSATIAAMSSEIIAKTQIDPGDGFIGALAFYPACQLHDTFSGGYEPCAPLRLFAGDADEEVSTRRCVDFVEGARKGGGDVSILVYPGATHGFDDPGDKRQRIAQNARATEDAVARAQEFVRALFSGSAPQQGVPRRLGDVRRR
ncbi:MAG TPA: dienelactone hydrolase family protein [Methylocystis sp.]|nr:dienelactone hydrolase family protein [Methylocystis sp.]